VATTVRQAEKMIEKKKRKKNFIKITFGENDSKKENQQNSFE